MFKKNLKKFAAISLAATMVFGSTMTIFAAGENGEEEGETTPTAEAGVSEGTGSYEGGEMTYPTISVTLPTIPEGTYDYIADPNGLIAKAGEQKYEGAVFTGTTGIFFKTSSSDEDDDVYTEKSAAQKAINKSAQDVDVTVKLEQKTAGDAIIKYADSATFEDTDTENKLYLAVTDDAENNTKVAALTASGVATLTTTVEGIPGNFAPGYNGDSKKYGYTVKDDEDEGHIDWHDCSFILTGAINKNAKWGDDVNFPTIKVTWTYTEHKESVLSSTTVSKSANEITVDDGVTVTKVVLIKKDTTAEIAMTANNYTFANGKLTFVASMLGNNVGGTLKVTLSNGTTEDITIQ